MNQKKFLQHREVLGSKVSKNEFQMLSGELGGISVGDEFPVRIMGVINLSKNSFYKGSVMTKAEDVVENAIEMEAQGADFIDIGARSTAPYREGDISSDTEAKLLKKAIVALYDRIHIPLSVDTARVLPARVALDQGVKILNDPHGLTHQDGEDLATLAAKYESSLIVTAHEIQMGRNRDPMRRVSTALANSLKIARKRGVKAEKIVVDPGIGFFSDDRIHNVEWNCTVLANLEKIRNHMRPILVGVSRKRFLGIIAGDIPPEQRLIGSLSATAVAVFNGANIIRTHDVKETLESVAVASSMRAHRQKRLSDEESSAS